MSNLLEAEDPRLTVEAATAEEAIAEIHAALGPSAQIVSAQRMRKGGLAGFFAREVVELVATTPKVASVKDALAKMVEAVEEPVFARMLAKEMTTPEPALARPAGIGEVMWSADRMIRLSLPPWLVDAVTGLQPIDDLAWINAVARAVAPCCGSIPAGNSLVVGRRAGHVCDLLGIPWNRDPQAPAPQGTAGWVCEQPASAGTHLRGRWLHLVTDDVVALPPSQRPAVISWTRKRGVAAALHLAHERDSVLGWGVSRDGHLVRATPADVAFSIRSMMERS